MFLQQVNAPASERHHQFCGYFIGQYFMVHSTIKESGDTVLLWPDGGKATFFQRCDSSLLSQNSWEKRLHHLKCQYFLMLVLFRTNGHWLQYNGLQGIWKKNMELC